MIKLFLSLILILIALPLYANPCMQLVMGGTTETAAPPAACETQANPTDMETYAYYFSEIHSASGLKYVSSKFVAGGNDDICKICIYISSSTGTSPTYNQTLYIYGDISGEPNETDIKATFETKNMTGILTGSYQWICWNKVSGSALSNGTTYHIVSKSSTYDGTNIQKWGRDSTCASEAQFRSSDGATWASLDTSTCGMAKLYKE